VDVTFANDDDFGRWVKERRHALGLSLRQLSARAGLSNPYISQIERGLRPANEEIRNRLIALLGEDGEPS
jgi:transcriptional regulator with XRE-family HTH domain